jgi:hypothetical protein
VRLSLKTWVQPLDAEPRTGCVDVTLLTADGEPTVELTPAEARALATALVMLTDTAERDGAGNAARAIRGSLAAPDGYKDAAP